MATNREEEEELIIIARPYQTELYLTARERNTIVCLGTGTGKTFIAILLMKDPVFAQQLKGDYPTGRAKRTFFLVPTRPLVKQQTQEICRHWPTIKTKVSGYTGDMNVDFWDEEKWTQELIRNEVLVMTPQILLNMLNHSFVSFKSINLLVIDEVHWAARKKGKKDSGHPYKQIMKLYKEYIAATQQVGTKLQPRILGLSASLINSSMKLDLFDDAVKDLEETYCAECNTSDVAQLCGTNPREIIWSFQSQKCSPSLTAISVVRALDHFIIYLKSVNGTDDSIPMSVTRIKKCLTNIRNMLSDPPEVIIDPVTGQQYPITMTWMGVWCASVAIDRYIEEISQYRDMYLNVNPNHANLLELVINYLANIKDKFQPELRNNPNAPLNTASPKMHRLLELLRKYKPNPGEKSQLCGIVFVNQRSVAKVLSDWLIKLKEMQPQDYQHLKVNWVVGHSARPGFESLVTSFTDRQQQQVIDDFHSEKLNLLVATSVLEEGLDVRKCNLVIRYDRINTFREYLQSKGRARADGAYYYMMTPEDENQKLKAQLMNFRDMEKRIENLNNERQSQAVMDDRSDSSDDDEHYVNSSSKARITTRTAISLLYRYCNKLPTDSFTKLIPIFDIQEEPTKQFRCSVQLPVNSPQKQLIYGKACKSKRGAKKSAALEACKQLHVIGELDDRFLPISKEQFIEKYVEELGLKIYDSDSNDKERAGTRTRNQIYSKQLAQVFTRPSIMESRNEYFLHRISVKYPQIECFSNIGLTFGVITSQPIVNKCSFPVFVNVRTPGDENRESSSKCEITFMPMNAIALDSKQRQSIEEFHRFTLSEVILDRHLNENLVFNSIESKFNLLIVPLMGEQSIDWTFVDKINNLGPIELKAVSVIDRKNFIFNAQLYNDCVFYPWYRPEDEKPLFYDSLKVTDSTPKSKWADGSYESYEHRYRCRYGVEICNKGQPLIEGRLVKNCAQLKPFQIGKVVPNREERFVPELVTIHPFPSSLWRQALCLPAVLYRLNHLFLAEELRQRICLQTIPRIGSFDPKENYIILKEDMSSDIIDSSNYHKRCHSLEDLEDLEDGCEGHPFDYSMDNEWSILMPKKKKQRNGQSILIESVKTVLNISSTFIGNIALNTGANSAGAGDESSLLEVTRVVIRLFGEVINKFRKPNGYQLNQIDLERLPFYGNCAVDTTQQLSYGDAFPFHFSGSIEPYIRNKYDARVGDRIEGPTAGAILKALTLLNANDAYNLERLETIGDSFLKFITTAFLYYSCPELDEGRLSFLRSIQICNCNLYHIGKAKHIPELIVSHKWYPKQNWLPPSYETTDECDCQLLTDDKNTSGAFTYHLVNDKSVADCIEALIGAHLLNGGTKSALIFMQWLGLKVSPNEDQIDYKNLEKRSDSDIFRWLPEPKSPIWNLSQLCKQEIEDFFCRDFDGCNLSQFEEIIDYKFEDKAFLIEALTHSSYYQNRSTDCYQRLEFLGDSVLDYLITRHIYDDRNKKFNPGELTDLRSALVNNSFFASIAVKFNFHKFLKFFSPDLFRAIESFVKKFEYNQLLTIRNSYKTLTDEECSDLEEVEVPKALGDIFESVAGAVFLDSRLSLDCVWKVFFKLLKPEIDYFSANVPLMPVRELREKCKTVLFGESKQITGRKIRVVVTADGKEYAGVGKSRKFAKIAASKNALRSLRLKSH